jgi:hypothetical protein
MSAHVTTPAMANRNRNCIQIEKQGALIRKIFEERIGSGICPSSFLNLQKLRQPRVCIAAAFYAGALSCACGACAWQSLLSFVFSASPFRF